MAIKVKSYLTMRKAMGNRGLIEVEYSTMTLHQLIVQLAARFGQDFRSMVFEDGTKKLGQHVKILINGRHYGSFPDKLNTEVKDGDEVSIFPPIAGG